MTEASAPLCPQCQCDLHDLFGPDASTRLTFCPQCQFPLALIAGKYKLQKKIGQGGFGKVYLAEHVRLIRDRERVVKILNPEIFKLPGMEARFFREVQVTSSVARNNDHIVRIYDDFGKHEQLGHFYVMEYLEGQPLSDFLKTQEALPLSLALHIFEQLCEAMDAAHADKVIHRDLKPDNIFLIQRKEDDAFVKVLDFGIAKPTDAAGLEQTQLTQGALGTPLYMAPEQWANKPIDARIDIYAMGIILYQMLTGRLPFPIERSEMSMQDLVAAHLHHAPLPWSQAAPGHDLPSALEPVVLKALEKNRDERYHSTKAFWAAIETTLPKAKREAPPSLALIAADRQISLPHQETAAFDDEPEAGARRAARLPTVDSKPVLTPSLPQEVAAAPPSNPALVAPATPPPETSLAEQPLQAEKTPAPKLWLGLSLACCALILGALFWWVQRKPDTTQGKTPPKRLQASAQKGPTARPRKRPVVARTALRRARPRPPTGPCPGDKPQLRWLLLKLPKQHKARVQALDGKPPIARRLKVPEGVCIGLARATSVKITALGQSPCHFPVAFRNATLQVRLKKSSFDDLDPNPDYCIKSK